MKDSELFLQAISVPNFATLLAPKDAYALHLTSKKAKVCFAEIGLRDKIRLPKVFCSAMYFRGSRSWTCETAVALYSTACATPYKTKGKLVRQFLAKVLSTQELYRFGKLTNNAKAMWLAVLQRERQISAPPLAVQEDYSSRKCEPCRE